MSLRRRKKNFFSKNTSKLVYSYDYERSETSKFQTTTRRQRELMAGLYSLSRSKEVIARRPTGDGLLEQLAEQYKNSPLEAAKFAARGRRSVAGSDVIGGGGHLLLVTSIGADGVPQSDLAQRADEKLFHAMIEQRRDFDKLAMTLRRHVLAV